MSADTIRLAIDVENAFRELVVFRERANGDLVINHRNAKNQEIYGRLDVQKRNEKISVHRSTNSNGTTIKSFLDLRDDPHVSTASFIKDSKDNLLWIARCSRIQILSGDEYRLDETKNGQIVSLGRINQKIQTLLICISVLSKRRKPPVIRYLQRKVISFRYFDIGIHYGFMLAPSGPHGDFCSPMTSLPRYGHQPLPPPIGDGAKSLSNKLFQLYIAEMLSSLAEKLSSRTRELFGESYDPRMDALPKLIAPKAIMSSKKLHRGEIFSLDQEHSIARLANPNAGDVSHIRL